MAAAAVQLFTTCDVPRKVVAGWVSEAERLIRGHIRTLVARTRRCAWCFLSLYAWGGRRELGKAGFRPQDDNEDGKMKNRTAECS